MQVSFNCFNYVYTLLKVIKVENELEINEFDSLVQPNVHLTINFLDISQDICICHLLKSSIELRANVNQMNPNKLFYAIYIHQSRLQNS
jgi:hypothetical protein